MLKALCVIMLLGAAAACTPYTPSNSQPPLVSPPQSGGSIRIALADWRGVELGSNSQACSVTVRFAGSAQRFMFGPYMTRKTVSFSETEIAQIRANGFRATASFVLRWNGSNLGNRPFTVNSQGTLLVRLPRECREALTGKVPRRYYDKNAPWPYEQKGKRPHRYDYVRPVQTDVFIYYRRTYRP